MIDPFEEMLPVLGPYLPDLMIIGGWVPELHRRYGGLAWQGRLPQTTEFDVLIGAALAPNGRPPLRTLMESGGLRPARADVFPADWAREADGSTVIEFLMLRPGPRRSAPTRNVEHQGYLGAIVLDDADLMLDNPCRLALRTSASEWVVRVPTIGAWTAGKLVTCAGRHVPEGTPAADDKRSKDLLYVRDVFTAGPAIYDQLVHDVKTLNLSPAGRRALAKAARFAQNPAEIVMSRAAAKLAERDSASVTTARSSILGAITELGHMISERLER